MRGREGKMAQTRASTPQEACLLRVAARLNDGGVPWALGASMMLWYRGIVDAARDIDMLVREDAADRAAALLRPMGEELPQRRQEEYASRSFHTFVVDDVEIDVIAGFTIRHSAGVYVYPLQPEHWTRLERGGIWIYLTPLEDWFLLYQLMDREHRVRQIEEFLLDNGMRKGILQARLTPDLPEAVRQRAELLLERAASIDS